MIVTVQITQQVFTETLVNLPDGLTQAAIKQQVFNLYNSGQLALVMDNFHVVFEEINAQILTAETSELSQV
ncbi:hypothetical protein [Aulosira sp. FACHB-615]|uniref:hypothetical protein n=1 Tax=Aulosira sp. FACHB-615 TaxID=2692777 RepID=UPI001689F2CF|nr:hypothetical protein [Aulosira sp. FACHB-615]MBD2492287.1 hypothetical protein [Aulosira sp. FACHB-615]